MAAEVLFPGATRPKLSGTRRKSTNGIPILSRLSGTDKGTQTTNSATNEEGEVDYVAGLRDILERISQHVDPVEKLQACHDFSSLAVEQLQVSRTISTTTGSEERLENTRKNRRKSLDPRTTTKTSGIVDRIQQISLHDNFKPSDAQINRHIKQQLVNLRPQTVFRDLQYIAVFTPRELLEKTPAGDAFVHLGMAALDYKNELCRSMIDIADQIVAVDGIKRTIASKVEHALSKAAEYWKIGAVEGNAVAMRELASLYLIHPEMLPVITSPLVASGEIFKEEKMWQKKLGNNNSRQALCLALHWMQQAARKGDKIAFRRLEERERPPSTP